MTAPASLVPPSYGPGFWFRLGALAALDAVAIYAVSVLVEAGAWGFLASLVLGTLAVNYVYLSPRTRASRWITPGLLLMLAFVVWPLIFSFYIALTNWATGNILTKDQAIERLEAIEVAVDPDSAADYEFSVYRNPGGDLRFYLVTDEGLVIFGEPRSRSAAENPDALEDPEALGIVDDGDGVPEMIGDFTRLETRDLFAIAQDLQSLILDLPGEGEVVPQTVTRARLVQSSQRYEYDAETDTLFDTVTGATCDQDEGNFVCDGVRLDPGWRVVIGFENFTSILGNERIRGPFMRVLVWNFVFAGVSVASTLALGLSLAMAMQDARIKGRPFYRSILILPYAIPAFISAIVWRGLFNSDFGQINRMLEPILSWFGSGGLNWLGDPTLAKLAVLIVNLWLGFPYMFLICLGALQSIPQELQEAARVDGASAIRRFRSVTFPLLMVSIAPLLIGSFAFNFNNFVLIFLLTDGGPPVIGSAVPVGHTDILISFTFDLAVQSGRGNNFGLGSALAILIFILVALFSAIGFRYSRRLEDVYA